MTDPILMSKSPVFDEIPEEYLIESDGEPMETFWHVQAMEYLKMSVIHHFRGRHDFFTGGNAFIYYSKEQAKNKDFRGPDFFFVWNTTRLTDRQFWYVWKEKRTPNVVIELISPTTRKQDYGPKKDIYEQILQVSDYYCYDPDGQQLHGWRLHGREYAALIPNERGWLWCEEMQLWLGAHFGTTDDWAEYFPRFFDPAGNLVLTGEEAANAELDLQRNYAEEQKQNADEQRRNAEEQERNADEQKQRADKADAEIAILRERLALLEKAAADSASAENDKQ